MKPILLLIGLLISSTPALGQLSFEVAGGRSALSKDPLMTGQTLGSVGRVAIGFGLRPRVRLRVEALEVQNRDSVGYHPPCAPLISCPSMVYDVRTPRVVALIASGVVALESRGILYALGGVGVYRVRRESSRTRLGASIGLGAAVPIYGRLRVTMEASWHQLEGSQRGPLWLQPVTVGLRL